MWSKEDYEKIKEKTYDLEIDDCTLYDCRFKSDCSRKYFKPDVNYDHRKCVKYKHKNDFK